jgi:D-alanyl-D-alanine carboxypeptidase
LLHEEDFKSDNFTYESKKPILSAKHYLVADLLNNFVLLKSDGDSAPVASITKLMTALVATEYINLDNEATVPKEAIVFTSKPRLVEGEKVSIYQLLFPLLLESSNEAAETIARFYGRSNFIEKMNEKAISIGMTSTKFEDASGALSGNVSTVDDLFMLAKYIYNNRSFIFNLSSGKLKVSAYGESYFKNLSNLNDFSEDKNFFGGKVGKTTVAMETGLFVFKLNIKGEERPIVVIVLGSENRKLDTENILNYIKSNY